MSGSKAGNIFDEDSTSGKVIGLIISILVIVSLITFSIESIPKLDPKIAYVLEVLETIITVIFTIEYLVRILASDNRLRFIFSFYGIVDLLAILPFYIASFDFRSVRVFRLLRLARLFKIFRYTKASGRLKYAFTTVKDELILTLIITIALVYSAAVGIYHFEHMAQPESFKSVFDGLWWAIVTLTTVGYGDVYPVTIGGRLFTGFLLLVGLGAVAVPTGLIASALTMTTKDM